MKRKEDDEEDHLVQLYSTHFDYFTKWLVKFVDVCLTLRLGEPFKKSVNSFNQINKH